MCYSYEYKRKCVQLHRQGKWAKSPAGISTQNFHNTIRKWDQIKTKWMPPVKYRIASMTCSFDL